MTTKDDRECSGRDSPIFAKNSEIEIKEEKLLDENVYNLFLRFAEEFIYFLNDKKVFFIEKYS